MSAETAEGSGEKIAHASKKLKYNSAQTYRRPQLADTLPASMA